MNPMLLIRKDGEFYLGSLDESPKDNDIVFSPEAEKIGRFEDLSVGEPFKIIKSTNESLGLQELNKIEVERLIQLQPEDKYVWLVQYTKQNYLMLL